MTDREAYVAFNLTDQIGSVGVAELVRGGSVADAWEAYPKKVSRTGGEVDWQGEFDRAKRFGVEILTPADPGYPRRLLDAQGHPLALYVKGDVAALSKPMVALVGTRRATAYGSDTARRLASDLASAGWCVLSGLALGIDADAHRGALDAGGVTVGVIGSGLDEFYPEQNRELAREIVRSGGAVVSEFPFGRKPDQQTFPQRNHVVAALSSGVVAVEAPAKSGTLITTGIAAELGRTVMAVPARIDSRMSAGCLKLIREGATLVRGADDVLEALSQLLPPPQGKIAAERGAEETERAETRRPAPRRKTVEMPAVTLEESLVLREADVEGVSMDRLVRLTGLPAERIAPVCMSLRLKGRLRFLPGNRVAALRSE